jgi:hypothetical protein
MKRTSKKRIYTVTDLLTRMRSHGLPSSRMWLHWQELKGNLVCPRLPNNRGDRVFTMEEISEILQAFGPEGDGVWKYDQKR